MTSPKEFYCIIKGVELAMETKKSILTVSIPQELNEKFTEYSRQRCLAKNAILITLIEDLLKIPMSEATTKGNR